MKNTIFIGVGLLNISAFFNEAAAAELTGGRIIDVKCEEKILMRTWLNSSLLNVGTSSLRKNQRNDSWLCHFQRILKLITYYPELFWKPLDDLKSCSQRSDEEAFSFFHCHSFQCHFLSEVFWFRHKCNHSAGMINKWAGRWIVHSSFLLLFSSLLLCPGLRWWSCSSGLTCDCGEQT